MKTFLRNALLGTAGALALTSSSLAQSQEQLQAKLDEKLSLEFIEYGGWATDYEAARDRAKKEGKVLFVYFSRSYAP